MLHHFLTGAGTQPLPKPWQSTLWPRCRDSRSHILCNPTGRALTLDCPQPDRGLKSVGRYVRRRVEVSTRPFPTPTFYEKNLLLVLPWFEWVVLATNSPCRIWGSGLHADCSPLVLQPSSLFGKCPDLGFFVASYCLQTLYQGSYIAYHKFFYFSFVAKHLNVGHCWAYCLAVWTPYWLYSFHQKPVSSTSSIVGYFPHNCSSTGCRDFIVSLVPVYIAGLLKESLELSAPKRPVAFWLWKQMGVQDPRWTPSTQRPVSNISKKPAEHLASLWTTCGFSSFSYLVLFFLLQNSTK